MYCCMYVDCSLHTGRIKLNKLYPHNETVHIQKYQRSKDMGSFKKVAEFTILNMYSKYTLVLTTEYTRVCVLCTRVLLMQHTHTAMQCCNSCGTVLECTQLYILSFKKTKV
jgi:hypothetical protein